MKYINHFGEQSGNYLQFRPDYPANLYEFILSLVTERQLAWDCGTGNGQAAAILAEYFTDVIATDINEAQLAVAVKKNNISYYAWPAEKTEIKSGSVDLITIAQALHWFNFAAFYAEVKRVAKPKAIIAAWCYALIDIDPAINAIINKLYNDILGDHYWPKERRYIDEEYKTIPFPFIDIPSPVFNIQKKINFEQLIGYLNTWSAVKEYAKQNGQNPIELIYPELHKAWGMKQRQVSWPIYLKTGSVDK